MNELLCEHEVEYIRNSIVRKILNSNYRFETAGTSQSLRIYRRIKISESNIENCIYYPDEKGYFGDTWTF